MSAYAIVTTIAATVTTAVSATAYPEVQVRSNVDAGTPSSTILALNGLSLLRAARGTTLSTGCTASDTGRWHRSAGVAVRELEPSWRPRPRRIPPVGQAPAGKRRTVNGGHAAHDAPPRGVPGIPGARFRRRSGCRWSPASIMEPRTSLKIPLLWLAGSAPPRVPGQHPE